MPKIIKNIFLNIFALYTSYILYDIIFIYSEEGERSGKKIYSAFSVPVAAKAK